VQKKTRPKSNEQKNIVVEMYLAGHSPKDIAYSKNYYQSEVELIIQKHIQKNLPEVYVTFRALGHKSEPYYKTEWEMMYEPHYSYNSLSPSEKEIYNESRTDK